MYGTVVVAYDGSDHAEDALALARALRRSTHGLLLLTCVASSAEEGQAILARAREELGDPPYARYEVTAGGHPSDVLHRFAERERADLIVIGSSHRGTLGRVLLGSVATATLRHAPCPVAVAPAGYRDHERELRAIGAAYDARDESRAALAAASRIAASLGSELAVVGVLDLPALARQVPAGELDSVPAVRTSFRGELDDALADLPEGLRAHVDLREGPVATQLRAATDGLDLLVMGSRSLGPLDRVLLGSVSEAVVRDARCPVLIVPRPAEEA